MKTNFGTTLSRNEMKNIYGGKTTAPCSCSCKNITGSWFYTNNAQPPGDSLHSDISTYCDTYGGTCTNCANWS